MNISICNTLTDLENVNDFEVNLIWETWTLNAHDHFIARHKLCPIQRANERPIQCLFTAAWSSLVPRLSTPPSARLPLLLLLLSVLSVRHFSHGYCCGCPDWAKVLQRAHKADSVHAYSLFVVIKHASQHTGAHIISWTIQHECFIVLNACTCCTRCMRKICGEMNSKGAALRKEPRYI